MLNNNNGGVMFGALRRQKKSKWLQFYREIFELKFAFRLLVYKTNGFTQRKHTFVVCFF